MATLTKDEQTAKAKRIYLIFFLSLPITLPLILYGAYKAANSERSIESQQDYTAFTACRSAIRAHALNPDAVKVPHITGFKVQSGDTMHIWKPGSGLLMPNMFGAQVQAFASCRTDPSGTVNWLKIGDDVVVG